MNILLVFATRAEADILTLIPGINHKPDGQHFGKHRLFPVITGVGGMATAWSLKQWLSINSKPDLAINAGIAGCFNQKFKKGEVVMVITDCFGDAGIEIDGKYLTLSEAGLNDKNEVPFKEGLLVVRNKYVEKISGLISSVKAVTVNTATGSHASIKRLADKFNPDIETMEGATFFYICIREKIPFLALRAISNYVEPGKRSKWEIPLALENLAAELSKILNLV